MASSKIFGLASLALVSIISITTATPVVNITAVADGCDVPRRKNVNPFVDCYYDWEHSNNNNFLNYVVKIDPSGQDSRGWCQGVWDNMRGLCEDAYFDFTIPTEHGDIVAPIWQGAWKNCNDNYHCNEHGCGIDFNFHFPGVPLSWKAGEDNRQCVTEAIRRASCDIPLNLNRGGCWLRNS